MSPSLAASLLLLALNATGAGDPPLPWAQFRGPGAAGVSDSARPFPIELGPEKNVSWKVPVSPGHSSPCVTGDRIFLTGRTDDGLETVCLDRVTGVLRWRQVVPVEDVERLHEINGPASPTPAADAERVYVSFGSFGLLCYDHDGVELWRRPLAKPDNTFGTACSPIVAGDYLLFNRDTDGESWLEAIHRKTGRTAWRRERTGFRSGWSTPIVRTHAEGREVIVYGAWRLVAYDLATGDERWSVPGLTDEPCTTPVLGDGLIFLTSYNMRTNPEVIGLPSFATLLGDYDADANGTLSRDEVKDNASILSRLDADGEGDHPLRSFFRFLDRDRDGELTAAEWQRMFDWLDGFKHLNALLAIRPGDGDRDAEIVWQHPRGVPECPSPLYYEGHVYTVKNGGIASCLAAATGDVRFEGRIESRGPCYASPVVGGGRIYTISARGTVTVLGTGAELDILARNELGDRVMASPALVDGTIYVRSEKYLWAFALPE